MKKYEELSALVLDWAKEKDLLHGDNAEKQFYKFIEEVFEFKTDMDRKKDYEKNKVFHDWYYSLIRESLEMEMGDILVTLIILSKQLEIDLVGCLEMAYEKISKRKGKTIDGTFVKEEDL